jgi:hypothetical protein
VSAVCGPLLEKREKWGTPGFVFFRRSKTNGVIIAALEKVATHRLPT